MNSLRKFKKIAVAIFLSLICAAMLTGCGLPGKAVKKVEETTKKITSIVKNDKEDVDKKETSDKDDEKESKKKIDISSKKSDTDKDEAKSDKKEATPNLSAEPTQAPTAEPTPTTQPEEKSEPAPTEHPEPAPADKPEPAPSEPQGWDPNSVGKIVGVYSAQNIGVNLRTEPSHYSGLAAEVPGNAVLYFYGDTGVGEGSDGLIHDWMYVYTADGVSGWVRSDLVY